MNIDSTEKEFVNYLNNDFKKETTFKLMFPDANEHEDFPNFARINIKYLTRINAIIKRELIKQEQRCENLNYLNTKFHDTLQRLKARESNAKINYADFIIDLDEKEILTEIIKNYLDSLKDGDENESSKGF